MEVMITVMLSSDTNFLHNNNYLWLVVSYGVGFRSRFHYFQVENLGLRA